MPEETECEGGSIPLLLPDRCAVRLMLGGSGTVQDPLRLSLELVGVDSEGSRPPPGSGIVFYTKTLGVHPEPQLLSEKSGLRIPEPPEEAPGQI